MTPIHPLFLALSLWAPPEIHPLPRLCLAAMAALLAVGRLRGLLGAVEPLHGGSRTSVGALAVGGALAASAASSLSPHASLHHLIPLAGACAFYVACRAHLGGGRNAKPAGLSGAAGSATTAWLVCFAVVAAGVALWACRQALGGMEQTLAAALEVRPGLPEGLRARLLSGRPFGTLLLPAALGGLMAMAAPVAAGLAAQARGASRLAAAGAALLFIAVLGLSRSYGALAGAAVAAAWTAARWGPGRALALRAGAALALVAALALAVRAREQTTGQHPLELGGPIVQRWLNWGTAVRIATRFPVLGCGPGAYASCFVGARQEGENDTRFAHNTPLQAAAEVGVWALLPLGFAVARVWPRLQRARAGPPALAGAATGLVAFAAHNLVDFTASLPSMLCAGLALAAVLPEARGANYGRMTDGSESPLPRRLALAALAAVCVGGLAPAWLHWRAQTLVESARELAREPDGRGEVASLYRRALELDPSWAEAHLEAAAFFMGGGEAEIEEALRHAAAAAGADRGLAAARLLESGAWLRRGEWAEAYVNAAAAAGLHPRDARARSALDKLEQELDRARAAIR
jgi:hypothetical protein